MAGGWGCERRRRQGDKEMEDGKERWEQGGRSGTERTTQINIQTGRTAVRNRGTLTNTGLSGAHTHTAASEHCTGCKRKTARNVKYRQRKNTDASNSKSRGEGVCV